MTEHIDTYEGGPQSREEVDLMDDEALLDFLAECDVDPGEPEKCLSCYAYHLFQDREAENEERSKSVMALADKEWKILADICRVFKMQRVVIAPEYGELADRIIKAADQ